MSANYSVCEGAYLWSLCGPLKLRITLGIATYPRASTIKALTRKQHRNIRRIQYAEGVDCHAWLALDSAPVDGVELCRTIPTGAKPPFERRRDD
jgi:hypothetical protein